jgi:hypothetical protein
MCLCWLAVGRIVIHHGAAEGAPEEGVGRGGGAALLPPQIKIKKKHFVERIISNVLCDWHFVQNQPLNLTDDCYIRILKNTIKKTLDVLDETKKTKMIRPCDWYYMNKSWNMSLYLHAYKCHCIQWYVTVITDMIFMTHF